MARTPRRPAEDVGQVTRAIEAFRAASPVDKSAEGGGAALKISKPIPLYSLGAPNERSDARSLLARTKLIGWRYLLFGGDKTYVADLRTVTKSVRILRGANLANRIANAGQLAEQSVHEDPDYEVRLLDLSLLGRHLLWLTSEKKQKPDRFFTLGQLPRELPAADLLNELSASERLKANSRKQSADPEAGG